MATINIVSRVTAFGGSQIRFVHAAQSTRCDMHCSVYLPPQISDVPVPVLYWLSGLTCTDENFTTKAGAQRYAAEHGIALVAPDTSPRGDTVPDDPDGAWDFGHGAGFYIAATNPPWNEHYQMYDYIVHELPTLINANFPIDGKRQSIFGHSMGGHGAITIALKNPLSYQSISAFAPIASPPDCPWGQKALSRYLGDDKDTWQAYNSCHLIRHATDDDKRLNLLVEQGSADSFLDTQLRPDLLQAACKAANYPLDFRLRDGYDHSYYFIATFIGEHIAFHAKHLHTAK